MLDHVDSVQNRLYIILYIFSLPRLVQSIEHLHVGSRHLFFSTNRYIVFVTQYRN